MWLIGDVFSCAKSSVEPVRVWTQKSHRCGDVVLARIFRVVQLPPPRRLQGTEVGFASGRRRVAVLKPGEEKGSSMKLLAVKAV